MIGKLAVALAAPFVLSNAQPAQEETPPLYANIPQIRQVMCAHTRGTAWRNGTGSFVTAWHVASGENCTIDGEPINITFVDVEHDMAILRTAVYGEPLPIDCSGYQDGETVFGVGYARGLPVQRVIGVVFVAALDAKVPRWNAFRTLYGDKFIPGQSGGPSITRRGVTGIVNGYSTEAPISYSQELKGTVLCPASASARQ